MSFKEVRAWLRCVFSDTYYKKRREGSCGLTKAVLSGVFLGNISGTIGKQINRGQFFLAVIASNCIWKFKVTRLCLPAKKITKRSNRNF